MKYIPFFIAAFFLPVAANAMQLPGDFCELETEKAYKIATDPGVYYISDDCKKRPILNSKVFFSHFDSWEDVQVTQQLLLDGVEDHPLSFLPWGPKRVFQNGSLIKTVTDPNVYALVADSLHPIRDEQTFLGLGYQWSWVEDVFPSVIAKHQAASAIELINGIPDYQNGMVVKYPNDPKVYQLVQGLPSHIDSLTSLDRVYRADRIITLPEGYVFAEDPGSGAEDAEESTTPENQSTTTTTPVETVPAPAPEPEPALTLSDNLIAYWDFNKNKLDQTGNGFDGSILGSVNCTTAGKFGRGCKIPKGGNQVVVKPAPLVNANISKGITGSAWVKFDGNKDNAFPWTVGDRNFYLEYLGEGMFECGMRASSSQKFYKTSKQQLPNIQSWQLFSCVYDRDDDELRFYIDAELKASASTVGFDRFEQTPAVGMGIGCRGPGRCEADIIMETVDLDDIRLYNRALTEADLQQLFTM